MPKHRFTLYIHPDNINFTLVKNDDSGKPEAFSVAYTVEIDGAILVAASTTSHKGVQSHYKNSAPIAAGGLVLTIGGDWTSRPAIGKPAIALMEAMHKVTPPAYVTD